MCVCVNILIIIHCDAFMKFMLMWQTEEPVIDVGFFLIIIFIYQVHCCMGLLFSRAPDRICC